MTNEAFSHRIKPVQTTKDPQSLHDLLGSSPLKSILKKAQQLQQIGTIFEQILPPHLHEFCTVLNVKHLQLIVGVSSAAAMTECRFMEPELLKQLKQHEPFQIIRGIQFRSHQEATV
ncbi:MAG: DUF721 domain-containing protein [Gammaproteobacteria bacterium]|nr:DUF721 domain-containing protein [Gammaproteobacteria bacterium]MCH9744746.1 DUF721 domain-containing protein [Gammaproteobacteria bacterium]